MPDEIIAGTCFFIVIRVPGQAKEHYESEGIEVLLKTTEETSTANHSVSRSREHSRLLVC
jgi:hypothetical protein